LEQETLPTAPGARGIFHTKEESLSAGGITGSHYLRRVSLNLPNRLWLNLGATALIVAMIETGLRQATPQCPMPSAPCAALPSTCQQTVSAAAGVQLSAVQIQRHYLRMAEPACTNPMPPTSRLRAMASLLTAEKRARFVASTLDWRSGSAFFDRAERRGVQGTLATEGRGWAATAGLAAHDSSLFELHRELCETTRVSACWEGGIFPLWIEQVP
jgi:hypothetical protein